MSSPKRRSAAELDHYFRRTDAPWYSAWELTEAERETYRERSRKSHSLKMLAVSQTEQTKATTYEPRLSPESLMPKKRRTKLTSLSLFSGCGGLDLGFDLAGFTHLASYEILEEAADVIRNNRPKWQVHSGEAGDVRTVDWAQYSDQVDVLHGGPPCQPFSLAGKMQGESDTRNLIGELVRAVNGARPKSFVIENVPALGSKRYEKYLQAEVISPLSESYAIVTFKLAAYDFGIPQSRVRFFVVGISRQLTNDSIQPPAPTHSAASQVTGNRHKLIYGTSNTLPSTMGLREALGLPNIGIDSLCPTLRSGLSSPRHTTSILSSTSALRRFDELGIWPNGVAASRREASRFIASSGHHRLAIEDVALIQGFPSNWRFAPPVYMAIGVLGNAVVPPVAYNLALQLRKKLAK